MTPVSVPWFFFLSAPSDLPCVYTPRSVSTLFVNRPAHSTDCRH